MESGRRETSWAEEDDDEDSSSSSSRDDSEIHSQEALSNPLALLESKNFPFAQHQGETNSTSNLHEEAAAGDSSLSVAGKTNSVPAEQERQLLLLMLLAQVCALHDPTPRTFTVHILELFERGILDRQSIVFLFELGLVPSMSPAEMKLSAGTEKTEGGGEGTAGRDLSVIARGAHHQDLFPQRTFEASAIRVSLEQAEKRQRFHKSHSAPPKAEGPISWSAESHPLSLSRYQREFVQVCQLSSGAFGQVFHATSNMDGRDYAIKRIPFSASGYSRESVQQVVREVHCLAMCDHANVVRYYTSWLEPSWMTGSGRSGLMDTEHNQKVLKDVNEFDGSAPTNSRQDSYSADKSMSHNLRRRWSFDASESSLSIDPSWRDDNHSASLLKEDIFADDIFDRSNNDLRDQKGSPKYQKHKREQTQNYRYQICLFIQMQLCHSSTLADWIRERNNSDLYPDVMSRIGPVQEILRQISRGLSHVHKKNIIHRDLKPANIFATAEGDLQFKIGDFGLSKVIGPSSGDKKNGFDYGNLYLPYSRDWGGENRNDNSTGTRGLNIIPEDPLTAGVGTASYASPEQASGRKYGKESDIFSLGLILLEMICSFGTEHERYQVFHDCRHRRIVPKEIEEKVPAVARIVLSCTEPAPANRPVADQLIAVSFQTGERDVTGHNQKKHQQQRQENPELEMLRQMLVDKDNKINSLETELKQKDKIIGDLRLENLRLQGKRTNNSVFTYPKPHTRRGEQAITSDSSSEEEL